MQISNITSFKVLLSPWLQISNITFFNAQVSLWLQFSAIPVDDIKSITSFEALLNLHIQIGKFLKYETKHLLLLTIACQKSFL